MHKSLVQKTLAHQNIIHQNLVHQNLEYQILVQQNLVKNQILDSFMSFFVTKLPNKSHLLSYEDFQIPLENEARKNLCQLEN